MPAWQVIASLAAAGALGGAVNAFLAHDGFVLPRITRPARGARVIRPGFLGNVFVGLVTAVVLAALYSPLGQIDLASNEVTGPYRLTLYVLGGALLSGIGGARLLTSEVDRRFDTVTKTELAEAIADLTRES